MGCSTTCIALFLVALSIADQQATEPSEITCVLSTTSDGLQFSNTIITIRPALDRSIIHEVTGSGYLDSAILCCFEDKPFLLFGFKSTKEKIVCKCATKYCDPDNAVIEQRLKQKRRQQISSMTSVKADHFEVRASRTQVNSSIYRLVLQFHRRFNATSNKEISSDNTLFAIGFVVDLILLLIYMLGEVIKMYLLQRERPNTVVE